MLSYVAKAYRLAAKTTSAKIMKKNTKLKKKSTKPKKKITRPKKKIEKLDFQVETLESEQEDQGVESSPQGNDEGVDEDEDMEEEEEWADFADDMELDEKPECHLQMSEDGEGNEHVEDGSTDVGDQQESNEDDKMVEDRLTSERHDTIEGEVVVSDKNGGNKIAKQLENSSQEQDDITKEQKLAIREEDVARREQEFKYRSNHEIGHLAQARIEELYSVIDQLTREKEAKASSIDQRDVEGEGEDRDMEEGFTGFGNDMDVDDNLENDSRMDTYCGESEDFEDGDDQWMEKDDASGQEEQENSDNGNSQSSGDKESDSGEGDNE